MSARCSRPLSTAMMSIAVLISSFGGALAQAPVAQSNQDTDARLETSVHDSSTIEFRQISPEARKVLVDEIRIQLQDDNEKRQQQFIARAEGWLKIGSSILAVMGALLALLGWRGIAGMRAGIMNDLRDFIRDDPGFKRELNARLNDVAESAASAALEKGRREISFARLEILARKVRESEHFTTDEVAAMKALLLSVKSDPEITSTEAFRKTAYDVLRSLYNADLDIDIDELEAEFRPIFVKATPICGQLIDSYGERLLEHDHPDPDILYKLKVYIDAIRQDRDVRPWAMPWMFAFLNHTRPDGWSKQIDNMLREVRYYREESRAWLLDNIKGRSERPDDKTLTYRQERERELVKAFYSHYREKLEAACASESQTSSQ